MHSSSINSHLIITISLWRSAIHFNRHTQRQQRLRELFDWKQNIIQGKCDNRWWLQFHWNTRGDGCTMECAVCFQFLYWIIFNCIRQCWNTILYFRIRAFLAHSIDSTNLSQQFLVSFFTHSSSINSHWINTISLWRSTIHLNRHTHRQQRLRELFDWLQNIIQGKCDNRWWLQFHWNTRGDDCNMECAVCFQFWNWIVIYCIRKCGNTILYFHIRAFPALSIESTNLTQQFFVSFFIHSSSINSHLIITISLWRSALHWIVTRIVNSACVNCLIDFKWSFKVSVTIAGNCNSIGTLEVMVATWNVLCVFNFCIELLFIIIYNIEIAFCIFVFDHS